MKTLYISNADLTREKRFTFATEDLIAGGSTLAIASILGFESLDTSSGQIVCIGEIGNERTELLRTSNTTGQSPSAAYKWIYLRDTMQFDHPQDTKIYIVDWNRVEAQWSATVGGSKQTLRAYPIQIMPDLLETVYTDTAQANGFYFTRFNETVGNTNSDYSDAVPYSGYDDNMVFSIKKRALDELGEEVDGKIITHEFLNECLWQARREYHKAPGKRPFRRKFNNAIGTALTGSFRIELPADVEKPYGAENVYGVRIGANANMMWYDKKELDADYRNIPHTTLTTAYAIGDQDLYLTSARDLSDSGAVSVEGTVIGYSAKSNTGGTLRISSAGSWAVSAGSDVWQNAYYGLPSRFNVFADPGGSAYIYFNRPIDTAYIGLRIYSDYYTTLPGYDSDADSLDEPDYDGYVYYLKAKIKARKVKGEYKITEDDDFKLWVFWKQNALATERLSTNLRLSPDLDPLPE